MLSAVQALWRLITHRAVLRLLGLWLGALFIYASHDKIIHADRFADAVNDYQMLPAIFINAFALAMPWLEAVAGGVLVLAAVLDAFVWAAHAVGNRGPVNALARVASSSWSRAAGLILTALTVAFMIAIAQAEIRGLGIECGCFDVSGMTESEASWSLFVRDIGYLLAAALLWRRA